MTPAALGRPRTVGVVVAVALACVLGVLSPATAGRPDADRTDADPRPGTPPVAAGALATAERVLSGHDLGADPSATVALRDLRRELPGLSGTEARRARALLARPTDPGDEYAYTAPTTRACSRTFCVHYATEGPDAPPSPEWVTQVLATMDAVYAQEVVQMRFRAPLRDGRRGGDRRFDVYLVDLGPDGLYGYCAPERRVTARTYTAYCALDDDFDPAQYTGRAATESLLVTAAHEFFHAIQFAYDATEDPWMLESTATWMEDQVADTVDDNRQYLQFGQLAAPQVPLDAFGDTFYQYGNWLWWEYLSETVSRSIVRKAWRAAVGPRYSLQVLERLLRRKGGLAKVYARYVAANLDPVRTYEEGVDLAATVPSTLPVTTLSAAQTRIPEQVFRVDHLASTSARLVPGPDLADPALELRLRLSIPARTTSPRVVLSVTALDGTRTSRLVRADRTGRARARVPFSAATVAAVDVSLVNASTRMRCDRDTQLACGGVPRDDGERFRLRGVVR